MKNLENIENIENLISASKKRKRHGNYIYAVYSIDNNRIVFDEFQDDSYKSFITLTGEKFIPIGIIRKPTTEEKIKETIKMVLIERGVQNV